MSRTNACSKRYGTDFGTQNWISLEAIGLVGVSFSMGIHFYALATIWLYLLTSLWTVALYVILYIPNAVLALYSLFMAATTNPGAVPMGARPLVRVRPSNDGTEQPRALRRCHKCQDNYKPPRAHHDSITGRCIVKFDHYCPWVNNAVGALNHKFFCLFLLYTVGCCFVALVLLIARAIQCAHVFVREDDGNNDDSDERRFLASHDTEEQHAAFVACKAFFASQFVMGLALSALLFLIFGCVMGVEQLDAISSGQGKIARMKLSVGHQGTEYNKVTEEFNELFGGTTPNVEWHWFLPWRPVQYPRGMEKVVLGYEWDDSFPAVPYQEGDADLEGGTPKHAMPEGYRAASVVDPLSAPAASDTTKTTELTSLPTTDTTATSDNTLQRRNNRAGASPSSGGVDSSGSSSGLRIV